MLCPHNSRGKPFFDSSNTTIKERPPGLIQHVLTVLVFLSWVLLLPWPPPSSRSLRLCPWASPLLHGPLDICLDLLPAAPPPPVQKRDAQHKFLQHRGAHTETNTGKSNWRRANLPISEVSRRGWWTEGVGAKKSVLCQRSNPLFCTLFPLTLLREGGHISGQLFWLFFGGLLAAKPPPLRQPLQISKPQIIANR